MRNGDKKKIKEIIATLGEIQDAGLYAEAQECVTALYDFITAVCGAENEILELLEQYYGLLYKASIGEVSEKVLRKYFIKIENSVNYDLKPDKIEIAFLSYNASMSDSIMSIYLAAKDDPQCDAYWIPIPFYECDQDGNLYDIHFHGAEYYPNIECIDWRKYNFEERRPDIIFTFNPYDEGNIVTRLDEKFYCRNLRNLTDLLVYVPYFVVWDDVPEHFAHLAGCVYSHKVIVQSEEIRETYIKSFKEAYGNRFGNAEEKFIALGSPKLDNIADMKREDYKLPNKFYDVIGDKKIVLYNYRLTDMTNGIQNQLLKLQKVLDFFRAQNDVLLWWRPHPLNMECMKSMAPHFAHIYEKLVEDYRQEAFELLDGEFSIDENVEHKRSNLIYDSSSDLHRSIAWSDAYYGDWSSVVKLYNETGKPIIIQNVFNNTDAFFNQLCPTNMICDGDYLWFTSTQYNALFKMKLDSREAEFVSSLPGEPVLNSSFASVQGVYKCNNKLYYAPYNSDNIICYDVDTNEFETIPLPVEFINKGIRKFININGFENRLVLIPHSSNLLLIYDIDTNEFIDCSENLTLLKPNADFTQNPAYENMFFFHSVSVENKIFMPYIKGNKVMVLDIVTKECEIKTVGTFNDCLCAIDYDGKYFWITSMYGNCIYRWDYETDECIKFEIPNEIINEVNYEINQIKVNNNKIYIISSNENKIYIFDTILQKITFCDISEDKSEKLHNYITPIMVNETLYTETLNTKKFVEFDFKQGKTKVESIILKESQVLNQEVVECLKNTNNVAQEEVFSLECFVEYIKDNRDEQDNDISTTKSKKNVGDNIYEYTKSLII